MEQPFYFLFKEHSPQQADQPLRLQDLLRGQTQEMALDEENPQYLGLNASFCASYFVGMRWIAYTENGLKHRGVLVVKPKRNKPVVEYMLAQCLTDKTVAKKLENCYHLCLQEDPIPVSNASADMLTPFVMAEFLAHTKQLVRQGLKRSFVQVKERLPYKIKGKILLSSTLRHQAHTAIAQPHCQYDKYSTDCLENRILKATLLQIKRLAAICVPHQWPVFVNEAALCLRAFETVSDVNITNADFNKIFHNPYYAEYKKALFLARFILRHLGIKTNEEIKKQHFSIPPYYINMPELFERYCEVLLRRKYAGILAGYGHTDPDSQTRSGYSQLRPDFLLPQQNMIIDSKYKYWDGASPSHEDIRQLCQYGRYLPILKRLQDPSCPPALVFIYPKEQDAPADITLQPPQLQPLRDYWHIYLCPILLPHK